MSVRPASEYRALMEANAELRRERDHAREEWHRQNERADDYRRQLLDETYRPEGGEIVLRELRKAQREREEALARIGDLEEDLERAIGDIEEWAAYADTYFREKWDLDGCLAWHREVLAGKKPGASS